MAQQVALLPAITLSAQVVFATFFGFLGPLLALPLTVVSQVWIHQVLVKDVLDRWSSRPLPFHENASVQSDQHLTLPTKTLSE